jgi:CRP/FNR family transcriptional regulator
MTAAKQARDYAASRICVSGLPHLQSLPPRTVDALEAMCRRRRYDAMGIVVHAGEPQEHIGFVRSGVLRMQKTLADGRQHIVGLLVAGDMFGRVYDGPQAFDIEAATKSEVCLFPRPQFEALLPRAPELDRIVMLSMLHDLDRARDWLMVVANQRITSRLAGFLLMLCTRLGGIGAFLRQRDEALQVTIPISRVDLAHLLGTRVESISRAFHALDDSGAIAILRPDLVELTDVDALCEEAGGDFPDPRASLKEIVYLTKARGG